MKKWDVLSKLKILASQRSGKNEKFKVDDLIELLLKNRGLENKKEIDLFLHGSIKDITPATVGIDKKQLTKALKRIKKAIDEKEQIVVFGDYDVDGICGVAILWETLHALGAQAMPYIPHRIDEGYGLSINGVSNVILNLFQDLPTPTEEIPDQVRNDKMRLIITVDNGIVASDAVDFANKKGIDVIITDHHVPPAGGEKKMPKAHAIVHTTELCGTSVAYLLAKEIIQVCHPGASAIGSKKKDSIGRQGDLQNDIEKSDHLALVALATVADLVPLKGANRVLLAAGLKELRATKRLGIVEICRESAIDQKSIDTYTIGHVIAPRLNAAGRLQSAMDSLRLICTKNKIRAEELARVLGTINKERQQITSETVQHALGKFKIQNAKLKIEKRVIIVSDTSYQAGIIGLVAGKLVEEFYKPSIVLSVGETHAKASARSVHGFNIIEFIRKGSRFLVDAGGHPMAAGFTVEVGNLIELQNHLEKLAETEVLDEYLLRSLRIDCELPIEFVSEKIFSEIQLLAPFGMGNPEPTFAGRAAIEDIRAIGKESKHLKLKLKSQIPNPKNNNLILDGIGFGLGEMSSKLKRGDIVEVVYSIDINIWNGKKSLQLKVKDIKLIDRQAG